MLGERMDEDDLGVVVAIVEDDDALRESAAVLLAAHGFRVRSYDRAEAFLADPAALEGLACLLCDQLLPGLSGVGLLCRLAEHGRAPPSILMSGRLTDEVAAAARAAGARAVLEKPVPPLDLVAQVRAATAA